MEMPHPPAEGAISARPRDGAAATGGRSAPHRLWITLLRSRAHRVPCEQPLAGGDRVSHRGAWSDSVGQSRATPRSKQKAARRTPCSRARRYDGSPPPREKDMRRPAPLRAAALGAALLLNAVPAVAQHDGYPLYPWCASLGRGSSNCYFSTWEQCRAAASGNSGYCYRNPWYEAYGPNYSFGRKHGRY